MTEDEMAGWHHRLDGHGFGWTLGVGDGQGGLARAGNRASRPGHRALARSSLLRDWFPCAGATPAPRRPRSPRPCTVQVPSQLLAFTPG